MNLAAWFTQSVTLYSAGAPNTAGDPSFGPGVSVSARVEANTEKVLGPSGLVTQATHAIYVGPDTSVTISDRIVLPGQTIKRTPLSVRSEVDKAGTLIFTKVVL